MSAKRLPVPITFLVVVAATIFLIIFFGAWAASADTGDRDAGALTFGFASNDPSLDPTALNSSVVDGDEGDADNGDWWKTAFLKACPLH